MVLFTIPYLLFLFLFPFNSHEVQLARFELTQKNGQLKLEIFVEKEDMNACQNDFNELPLNEKTAFLNDYIASHTEWYFNQKPYTICNYNYTSDSHHLTLVGYFSEAPENIQSIQVNNRLLIQEIPDHLNIIHVKLDEKLRSFRMDKQRQKITINYGVNR